MCLTKLLLRGIFQILKNGLGAIKWISEERHPFAQKEQVQQANELCCSFSPHDKIESIIAFLDDRLYFFIAPTIGYAGLIHQEAGHHDFPLARAGSAPMYTQHYTQPLSEARIFHL